MKIHSIKLKNFRRFEQAEFRFNDRFTVIVGDNATGKTAILDALAILAGSYLLDFKSSASRHIREGEIRQKTMLIGETQTLESQFPVCLSCEASVEQEDKRDILSWSRSIPAEGKKTSRRDAKKIIDRGREDSSAMIAGEEVALPVLAYYGTGRLWDAKRDRTIEKPDSRSVGYLDCLDPASNHRLFEKWFRQFELVSIQKRKTFAVVEAVRKAVCSCIPKCKNFYYDFELGHLVVEFADGSLTGFQNLSDGYRNMLAIVADIAHRAARLNPQLLEAVTSKATGLVLIDEIDLHLHPKWQRSVVGDLRKVFPNIQFIVTTHSPFVIQSLKPGEVIDLNNINDIDVGEGNASPAPCKSYVDRSIEDIVEDVMAVSLPSRSQRLQDMYEVAKRYYEILETSKGVGSAEKCELKAELDKLSAPFSENVAYHAFLEMERLVSGVDEQGDHKENN